MVKKLGEHIINLGFNLTFLVVGELSKWQDNTFQFYSFSILFLHFTSYICLLVHYVHISCNNVFVSVPAITYILFSKQELIYVESYYHHSILLFKQKSNCIDLIYLYIFIHLFIIIIFGKINVHLLHLERHQIPDDEQYYILLYRIKTHKCPVC